MDNARRAALYRRIEVTDERLQKHLDTYYKGGHTYTSEELEYLQNRQNRLNAKFVEILIDFTYDDVLYEVIQEQLYARECRARSKRSGIGKEL